MTIDDREEDLIEALAFAVDIVRDAMTTTEARLGRGDLFRALRDFEVAGVRARSVASTSSMDTRPRWVAAA